MMKNQIGKQEREQLGNRIVLISSVTFLYGLLLLFIQKMAESSMTVNGALAFIQILRWVSLAGAMLCAAWSAYKEKRAFFIYCGMCIFVFLSTTVLLYCGQHNKAFLLNYLALFIVFVMAQVYYAVKVYTSPKNKTAAAIFWIACLLLTLAVAVLCIIQRF